MNKGSASLGAAFSDWGGSFESCALGSTWALHHLLTCNQARSNLLQLQYSTLRHRGKIVLAKSRLAQTSEKCCTLTMLLVSVALIHLSTSKEFKTRNYSDWFFPSFRRKGLTSLKSFLFFFQFDLCQWVNMKKLLKAKSYKQALYLLLRFMEIFWGEVAELCTLGPDLNKILSHIFFSGSTGSLFHRSEVEGSHGKAGTYH